MNKYKNWRIVDNSIQIIVSIYPPSDFYQVPELLDKMLRNSSRLVDESYWLWRFQLGELPTYSGWYS